MRPMEWCVTNTAKAMAKAVHKGRPVSGLQLDETKHQTHTDGDSSRVEQDSHNFPGYSWSLWFGVFKIVNRTVLTR